ncbi:6392_t:CDS:1, partial [Acaulospora morrowiae]
QIINHATLRKRKSSKNKVPYQCELHLTFEYKKKHEKKAIETIEEHE